MTENAKRILILQLARVGDTIQSTPLFESLKKGCPDSTVSVVISAKTERVLEGNPFVDEVILFDQSPIIDRLVRGNGEKLIESYTELDDWLRALREREFDLVINITHSPLTALICRYLNAPEERGMTWSEDCGRVIKGEWPNYFFNMVFNRGSNEFNLVDLYRKFGGKVPPVSKPVFTVHSQDREAADRLFRENGITENDHLIVFQVGASVEDRRWPTASFAALGDLLVENLGAKILILGTTAEAHLGKDVVERMRNHAVDTCGQTNLGEAAAVLEKGDLLVTNDTGIMHLASCLPIKIVELSMSKVYYKETGAYGTGHVVVQADIECAPCHANFVCPHLMCRDYISPDAVFEAARLALRERPEGEGLIDSRPEFETSEIMVSRFTRRGFVEYVPCIDRPLMAQHVLNVAYRLMWQESLDGVADESLDREEVTGYFKRFGTPEEDLKTNLDQIGQALESLGDLGKEGRNLCADIAGKLLDGNGKNEGASRLAGDLTALHARIRAFGRTFSPVRAITSFFQFGADSIDAGDALRVAQETLFRHEQLEMQSSLLRKKLALAANCLSAPTASRT